MSATVSSASRLAAIAGNTFRESVRQRFFLILALMTAMLSIAAWWFRNCSLVAPQTKFLLDTGFGALAFFGAVMAIVATAESFSGEIERRTVLAVLAKPVWRGEFVLESWLESCCCCWHFAPWAPDSWRDGRKRSQGIRRRRNSPGRGVRRRLR